MLRIFMDYILAIPHFDILRFDIRYSAVRCSNYV
jgi:hypothetical protein